MEQVKYLVKRDYLNFLKGDIVSISQDMDGRFYFEVSNRIREVQFCGNEKGKWGASNPPPKRRKTNYKDTSEMVQDTPFTIIKEVVNTFSAMIIQVPKCPVDTKKFATRLYTYDEWYSICLNKIIDEFINAGAFEVIVE